jgi:hypothetical protein
MYIPQEKIALMDIKLYIDQSISIGSEKSNIDSSTFPKNIIIHQEK